MLNKLKNIVYVLINAAFLIIPSFAFASIADIQKSMNTSIRTEIMNALSSTALGWNGLGGQIFAVCFAIAMIQAFQKFGPEMLMALVKLGLSSWVVMALVGGPTYSSEISRSLFDQQGSGSLDLDLFNFLAGIGDEYAERLGLVDGLPSEIALAAETAKINIFIDRIFKSSKYCKSDSVGFKSCVETVISTGKEPPADPTKPDQPKSLLEKLPGGDMLAAFARKAMDLIEVITQAQIFLYTGMFPLVLLILTLFRFGANMCIFIILGLTTAVSMMLAKIIVPFYLLSRFEGTVIKSVKVPLSAALYGFAQAMVILLGYAIMKGVNQAVNSQFIATLTNGQTSPLEMAATMINMFAALYITQALIVVMQIMALLKIPKFCKDLLDLNLGGFVSFGEELFKSGVGLLGSIASISLAVASGGAALGGMMGNMAGLGGLGKVVGSAKGRVAGWSKGLTSKLNNSSLGKNISAGSSALKDRFESTTGYSLTGPGSGGVSVDASRTSRGGGGAGGDLPGAASGLAGDSMFPKSPGGGSGGSGDGSSGGQEPKQSLMDKAKSFGKDFVSEAFAVGAGGGGDLTSKFINSGLAGAKLINNAKSSKGKSAFDKASDKASDKEALNSQIKVANRFSATQEERSEALKSVNESIAEAPKTLLTEEQMTRMNELAGQENVTQAESDELSSFMSNNILSKDQEKSAKKLISKAHIDTARKLEKGRAAYKNDEDYQNDMSFIMKNQNRDFINNTAKTQTKALKQNNSDYAKYEAQQQKNVQNQLDNLSSQGFSSQGGLLSASQLMKQNAEGYVSKEQMKQLSQIVEKESEIDKTNFENKIRDAKVATDLGTMDANQMLDLTRSIEDNKEFLVGNNDSIKMIEEIRKSKGNQDYQTDLSFDLNDYKASSSTSRSSDISYEKDGTNYHLNEKTGEIESYKTKLNKKTGEYDVQKDKNGKPISENAKTVSDEFVNSLNDELANLRSQRSLMDANKDAYISRDSNGNPIKESEEKYIKMKYQMDQREKLINKALEGVANTRSKGGKK